MNRWLLKTEPSTYAWADLVRAGRAVWDGVRNPTALGHLRRMAPGDLACVYHTGEERAVVGVARILTAAYPDPKAGDPRLVVVDLEPVAPLPAPVPLAAIKARPDCADFPLVRLPRLSVMPVTAAQWRVIEGLGRGP